MATDWYYSKNGTNYGPVSSSELKALAERRELLPTDLVWKEGISSWKLAANVNGLFPSIPVAVAVPAPPAAIPIAEAIPALPAAIPVAAAVPAPPAIPVATAAPAPPVIPVATAAPAPPANLSDLASAAKGFFASAAVTAKRLAAKAAESAKAQSRRSNDHPVPPAQTDNPTPDGEQPPTATKPLSKRAKVTGGIVLGLVALAILGAIVGSGKYSSTRWRLGTTELSLESGGVARLTGWGAGRWTEQSDGSISAEWISSQGITYHLYGEVRGNKLLCKTQLVGDRPSPATTGIVFEKVE
jgi:hypothetical protein